MDEFRALKDSKAEESGLSEYKTTSRTSVLRSLTRLVIGGVLLGANELLDNLDKWETLAPATRPVDDITDDEAGEIITLPAQSETNVDLARYTLIGLVFDTQDRLQSGVRSLNKVANFMSGLASPIIKPFYGSRLAAPLRRRHDRLVLRGQQEVDRWIETGRTEDARSRSLAQNALYGSVDQSINYLTANDEIQELIQSQSVSLAGEVIEEVRERTVSADNFIEGVIRSMFRRPPRSELPEPPPEVKEQAVPFRQNSRSKSSANDSDLSSIRKQTRTLCWFFQPADCLRD